MKFDMREEWLRNVALYFCLCITIAIRVWLLVHTRGVIDGDEALVGIQAQHILQGERPIYFYGQVYMGSLEAYLVSLLFALFGSSAWMLRTEPILLSLVLVWLTWRCAHTLADRTALPLHTRRMFIWCSTLGAAILPLYDLITEMRTWGGHIEIYIVMLLLLLSALRLMDRWQAGAAKKELGFRWAGIGFLSGLGFWIYPLVISAVVAIAIWIALGILGMAQARRPLFRESLLALLMIPSAAVGALPALIWGAQNSWANVAYLLQQGGSLSLKDRIKSIWQITKLYSTCIGPHVIGGGLPEDTGGMVAIHSILFYGSVFCIGGLVAFSIVTYILKNATIYTHIWRIAGLPLLFAACTVTIFCTSQSATPGLGVPCGTDFVGRYAVPIMIALPFLIAAAVTTLVLVSHRYRPLQYIVIGLFLLSLFAQLFTYTQTDPGLTFQSPYCLDALANDDPVIAYLQHEHIKYAWSTNFVGNPITFKTEGQIIAIDPSGITSHQAWLNRLPAYTQAVQQAGRPSVLLLIASTDTHPQFLNQLDQAHIIYHVERFSSEPGVDLIVVTPINRSIPITTNPLFYGMFVCHK